MSFAKLSDVLEPAKKNHYAIGQFNINGNLWIEAILLAAEAEQAPIILAASDRLVDFLGGFDLIKASVAHFQKHYNITVPVVLHLDHGQTVERCVQAIDAGFSSVMFDGSRFSINENIKLTKQVTAYAHERNVSVEAEVGTVGGNEDGLISGISYASLADCVALVEATKVDALAAALGSVHGNYVGKPTLGFAEMLAISNACDIPLVLHGASGIPSADLSRAIELGHAKININTEINKTWFKTIREELALQPDSHEPRAILEPTRMAMIQTIRKKIRLFGASQQKKLYK